MKSILFVFDYSFVGETCAVDFLLFATQSDDSERRLDVA